jgi:hypothetical protein
MTRFRMIAGIAAGALLAAPALAQAWPYHHHHHHRYVRHARIHHMAYRPYAGGWARDTGAIVDHQLITNGPVPDTPANRARYGGPMSYSGRMTAPVGD